MQFNPSDIKKRIESLEKSLFQKKSLIENELMQVENICKELIVLKDKIESLKNPHPENKPQSE